MSSEELLHFVSQNPFFLAPMAGVTDCPFRSFMREMGAGVLTTELVSVKALHNPHNKSQQLMAFTENQKPVGIQIFGEDLQALSTGARIAENTGASFIDLNFGCPVTKITKKGAGAAMLKDLSLLSRVIRTVKKSVSVPVSIKVRTGWDQNSRNTPEVVKIAAGEGVLWVSIHGRTRSQAYKGQADWNYIKEVKAQSPVPVIGNGDLVNVGQILKLQKQSLCDGMMIGRGCLKNPWIFQMLKQKSSFGSQKKSYISVLNRLRFHLECFYQEERMFLLQYKKFCAWFSSGHKDSADFRRKIFQTTEKTAVLDLIQAYFHQVELAQKQNTDYEASLMQGHG